MQCKHIVVTVSEGVQKITFNRPEKKNAINLEMYEEIIAVLTASANDEAVAITALTGSGDFYSSGNDFSLVMNGDMEVILKKAAAVIQRFVSAFIDFPKILVAVINGPAIGVAVTTLALCDVVYASDRATFQTPFTSLGLSAEGCSSYTFPRIMGTSKASEMLYFNHRLSASEAKDCGLVSAIFDHNQLSQEVWPRLIKMAQLPASSLVNSKALVRRWDREDLSRVNVAEIEQLQESWQSEDCLNAIAKVFLKRSRL